MLCSEGLQGDRGGLSLSSVKFDNTLADYGDRFGIFKAF
jgi:hypothetical protein